MEGYYKVPRASVFDANGFFKTGDLGYLDETGCLHFANRLKDVIKTAGVNVAASEVEAALARHPGVKAAHVVGVPDAVRGENIAAFVVLTSSGSATPDELRAFCRESLASYKVPRHVFVIDEAAVPRTGTGRSRRTRSSARQRRARAASHPPGAYCDSSNTCTGCTGAAAGSSMRRSDPTAVAVRVPAVPSSRTPPAHRPRPT
jgi:fatty-acyl-CoA synthase